MSTVDTSNVARVKMMSLIADLAGAHGLSFTQLAASAFGRLEFQAHRLGSLQASVSLDGGHIEFGCYTGIHGKLYPVFSLDDESFKRTAGGELVTEEVALRLLRECFLGADDLRLEDDREDLDEEVFVVDPAVEQELIEEHHT